MNKNKTGKPTSAKASAGKYFKYAIGEIILVVIGILIALWISNWNTNRLNKERNNQLLIKLSKELDQNIARCSFLDTVNEGFKDRIKYSESALLIMDKGISKKDLSFLMNDNKTIYYTATLNLNTSVFEELKNTGSLYSIGSDSLVSSIQKYYQLCERESFYNLTLGETVIQRQEKCYEGWYKFKHEYALNSEKAIEMNPWIFNPQSIDYIYFRQFIDWVKVHSSETSRKLGDIILASEDLKLLIKQEVDKR